MGRFTILRVAILFFILSCNHESFEPDLSSLKDEITVFYEQQISGNLEGAMDHFDQFPYTREHVETEKRKFLEQNRRGKIKFNGCRVDVVNKYHTRGRLIWIYCDVERGGKKYSENYAIAAIYPSVQSKFRYKFYIGSVYYEDLSEKQ